MIIIKLTYVFILHINQFVYFMERNKKCRYISNTILNAQAPDKS